MLDKLNERTRITRRSRLRPGDFGADYVLHEKGTAVGVVMERATVAAATDTRPGRDLARLLALVAAGSETKPALTIGETETLAHVVSVKRDPDGRPRWPDLALRYRFHGSPPSSDVLYDDLLRLQAAGFIERHSPLGITPAGTKWLDAWEGSDQLLRDARSALGELPRSDELVTLSIEFATTPSSAPEPATSVEER